MGKEKNGELLKKGSEIIQIEPICFEMNLNDTK